MDLSVSVSFFKDELGPSIEQAVQAAVESVLREISKLIGGRLVGLQAELAETANENRSLRRRLRRSEGELKSVRERERTVVRPAPRFDEQLGAPAWGSTPVCTPLQQQQQQQQQDRAGEPSVSFLGDANGTGSEYTAAGFARCLPVLMSRDCAGDAAPLAERETSHLIIQADGTDRSVSIRDDEFPRIDDLWGGGCGGVVVGGADAVPEKQLSCPSSSSTEPIYIKEEIPQVQLITVKEEIPGLDPEPCEEEEEEEVRSIGTARRSDAASGFQDPCSSREIRGAFAADGFAARRRLQSPARELPNSCDECGATFLYSSSLKRHQRIHTAEKPYHCAVCGKSFKTGGNLRTHQQAHRGKKPYRCLECGSAFKEMLHLEKHKRIHTRDTPYRCSVCQKSFIRMGTLNIHQRIHTGEKPYHCTECGKSFRHSDCLKKHQRIHTGEKPYRCTECEDRFSRLDYLKKHQQVHKAN